MIEVSAAHIFKRFHSNWIIKDFDYNFKASSITGIKGRNGSGKSTLLRILAGFIVPSKGDVVYAIDDQKIKEDLLYKHMSYAAPYINTFEDLNAKELFDFLAGVKQMKVSNGSEFLDLCYLEDHKDKLIKFYSDGMKQRLKLAAAVITESNLLFLDEPGSYLDPEAKKWFKDLVAKHKDNRTIIIASNDMEDFEYCDQIIDISN